MFHAERLLLIDSERLSRADCVFDLQRAVSTVKQVTTKDKVRDIPGDR